MATYKSEIAISQQPNLIFLIMKICILRCLCTEAHLDIYIISAWGNASLHKSSLVEMAIFLTPTSNFLVIEILVTGYMSCERAVDQ